MAYNIGKVVVKLTVCEQVAVKHFMILLQISFVSHCPYADIRMAQYESGSRTPKVDLTNNLANVFGVLTSALTVPDIDSYNGLMHTLFTLEDLYGFRIDKINGELCIRLDKGMGTNYLTMFDMFSAWQEQAEKLKNGEITKEEYDKWRYNYPESIAFNSRK